MVKKKSIFKVKSILVVVLGVALLIMLVQAVIGPGGYQQGQKLQGTTNDLIRLIEAVKSENKQLENEIERLKTDPKEIEKIAREELGMVKPGEHQVVIKPNNNEKQATRTPSLNKIFLFGLNFYKTIKTINLTPQLWRKQNPHAGWSSLVARWAHNPKVAGSNPAPATNSNLP